MYYLVYFQSSKWCENDMITTKKFQSEEEISKFLNKLDEDKKRGWESEIILLVKGDRMQCFKQNVYSFSFPDDIISPLTEEFEQSKIIKKRYESP